MKLRFSLHAVAREFVNAWSTLKERKRRKENKKKRRKEYKKAIEASNAITKIAKISTRNNWRKQREKK